MTGGYFQGLRTPDGPMVTSHNPGQDPWSFFEVEIEWDTPRGLHFLAGALIVYAGHTHLPEEGRKEFIERFLVGLPSDRWTITKDEINRWYASHPEWVAVENGPCLF